MESQLLQILRFKLIQYYGPLRKDSSIKISILFFDLLMILSAVFGGALVKSLYGLSEMNTTNLINVVSLIFSGVIAMGIFLGMRGGITSLEPEIDFILTSPIKPSTYLLSDLLFQFVFLNVAATPPLMAFTMIMLHPHLYYLPIVLVSYEIMLLASSLIAQLLGVLKSVWNDIGVETLGWIILLMLFLPLLSTAIGFPLNYSTIPYPSTILAKYSLGSVNLMEGFIGLAYVLVIIGAYVVLMRINFLPNVTPLLTTALMEMPSSNRRILKWLPHGFIPILSSKMSEKPMYLMVKLNLLRIVRDGSLFTALVLFGVAIFSNISFSILIRQTGFSRVAALTFTVLYSPLIPSIFSINWGIVERESLWTIAVSEDGLKKYVKGMIIAYFVTTLIFSAVFYFFLNAFFAGTPFIVIDTIMLFSITLFASILSVIVSLTRDKPSNALSLGALLYVLIPLFGAIFLSMPVLMVRTDIRIADAPPLEIVVVLILYAFFTALLLSKHALSRVNALFDEMVTTEEIIPEIDFPKIFQNILLNFSILLSSILIPLSIVGCVVEMSLLWLILTIVMSIVLFSSLSVRKRFENMKEENIFSNIRVPWGPRRVILILLCTIIFQLFLELIITLTFPKAFLESSTALILGELALITPLLLYLLKKRISLGFLGVNTKITTADFKLILLMLPLMLLTGVLSGILVQTLIPTSPEFEKLFGTLIPKSFTDLVILVIITVLIIAPCEEMIFRGFVQRGLELSLGATGSVIVSSIVFGVFHFNPWQFLPAFILGFILGYVFRKSNYKIWCPIALHASYDVILIALSHLLVA
ncbi:MAG: CPBP family intramembrane metalloprotease [Candidatus Brockarchaeota archaeon]|nr:CPBP family intramembrane metalloprotease [Candidatus Brockarchaeota archaeon]